MAAPPTPSTETETKNVVVEAKQMMEARRDELAPLAQEFQEVEHALSLLNGDGPTARQPQRRQQRRQSTASPTASASPPKGRAKELLDVVAKNPGISVADAAKRMKLQQANYLYRIKDRLVEEGHIRIENNGMVPVAS